MRSINLLILLLLSVSTPASARSSEQFPGNATGPLVSAPANNSMAGKNMNGTSQHNKTNALNLHGPGNSTAGTPSAKTNSTRPYSQEAGISGPAFISLEDLSALRSQLDVLDVQVKIAERQKRLHELTLFALQPPRSEISKNKTPAVQKKHQPSWPKIVSIQGVDGRLSATLSSSEGIQTVTEGSNAGPGKVVSITSSKVLIHAKGRDIALKFKE